MHLLNIPIEIESPRVKEKYEISYKNDFVIYTFNKLILLITLHNFTSYNSYLKNLRKLF